MKVQPWIVAFGLALVASVAVRARADHHGMAMAEAPSDLGASVALVTASFDTRSYVGDYQGVVSSARWAHGRFGASVTVPVYRLAENGAAYVGIGDVAASAQAMLVTTPSLQLGAMAMVSAPTGNGLEGLGMGHAMAMPALHGAWAIPGGVVTASLGYSRALAHVPANHDHGVWPLVDPMNLSELTWTASGDHALTSELRIGLRASGGIPVGSLPGHARVIGALRVAFGRGRLETAAEAQAGLVGDPFTLRGVVETALRF